MDLIKLSSWKLKNTEKDITIGVEVPETVFEALLENEIIDDPFYGLNEQSVQWVYESDWVYETEFKVSPEIFNKAKIILRFYGLDTIADIYLNGELLSSVGNMFRTYEFNVKPMLNQKSNSLKILFHSPSDKAREYIEKYGVELTTGEENRALPGAPYLRKAQYSFGWDWGPILPDIGIWKPVELMGISNLAINSYYVSQEFHYNSKKNNPNSETLIKKVTISVKTNLKAPISEIEGSNYTLLIILTNPEGEKVIKKKKVEQPKEKVLFQVQDPELWWTHDLGEPNLYRLTIQLRNDNIIDEKTSKIGIRDIQLIRDQDNWGETFYFSLNGCPLFARGANWIPIDSFIPRGKSEGLYEQVLNYAKEANMNMIRVWGGGIYEDDLFFEICDSLGILVWQDFPFACAIYPIHESFYKNVEKECIDNIKRLRNHPSLALWCGNNEIEYLWNWLKVRASIAEEKVENQYKKGYVRLFEKMIPSLLKEFDPQRPYWPSSPSNGFCNINLGNIHSNSPDIGDSHYWSVWHSGKPFEAYKDFNSRFMSEFGFESFPSMKTINSFCPKEQFDIYSPVMENHQKNDAGNELIMKYMKKRFKVPKDFKKRIYLSQITQAEAIEYGVKHWRANRTDFHCMGSLYWQLNDCWPVASWSSIDYYGRWKALHYFAKRFYSPCIAYVEQNKDNILLGAVNDSQNEEMLLLEWQLLDSRGNILDKGHESTQIHAFNSKTLKRLKINAIKRFNGPLEEKIIFYTLFQRKTEKILYRGFKLFGKPNEFNLRNPQLDYNVENINMDFKSNDNLILTLKSNNVCLYAFIISDLIDFVSSDNFFSLKPNEERKIKINIKNIQKKGKKVSKKEIKNSLEVYSLFSLLK